MKKITLLWCYTLLLHTSLFAQRTISGTIADEAGEPLIGANVFEKDQPLNGTTTDILGQYQLTVPESATLVFSFIGYESRELPVGSSDELNVTLIEGVALSEVMVTALGITREKKSLGYSAQEIKGEELTLTRETNVISSLAGKIAGVQVRSASAASLGGSAHIRIRGSNGLTGGSPLFVVDGTPISNSNFSGWFGGVDYGNLANDINPDDIASITVLKGPSATALYGNRAANGVVMITTKKGTKQEGIGISFSSTTTAERVYILPEYQDRYGGGYDGTFPQYVDPKDGQTYNGLEYYADESWGPEMDGTLYRPWWSWIEGPDYGRQIPLTPNPDNVRDFFNTGLSYNNNLAISGGSDEMTYRLSYSNLRQKGIIPNSRLDEHNLSANATLNLTDKLSVSTNLNFANNNGRARPKFGWELDNPLNSFNQWFQRQLDMKRLRDYRNPDGTFRSWNIRGPHDTRPLWWDSPFFSAYENFSTDSRDRYFGNVTVRYKFNDQLSIEGAVRRDQYTQRIETRTATGGRNLDRYSEFVANGEEDNFDFLLKYNETWGDISLSAHGGAAYRENDYHSNFGGTVGGLNAPNLFNLRASVDRPSLSSYISEKKVQSVYASVSLGYNHMLFLGGTLRNDWSSALPANDNSYLYPSVSASFVFSELIGSKWLSHGKLRGAFAQVGSDTGPYQTVQTFSVGTPYGSVATFNIPGTLVNEALRPALSSSYEFGLEMRFLNNRFGFDVTYYREDNKDQILTLQVPGSSGYRSAIVNAGLIRDEGVELSLNAGIMRRKRFTWDLTFNAAHNESMVIELAEGLDNRILEGGQISNLSAPVGEEWGTFKGTAYKRINGMRVINEDGTYVTERDQLLGGILPDYTGGIINSLQLFGVELSAFIDFQLGGQLLSFTRMGMDYAGLSLESAGLNDKGNPIRNPVAEGGGYKVEGVLEDGSPHSVYVEAEPHFKFLFNIHEHYTYDATYVKLREIRAGYNLPGKWLSNTPLAKLNLALVARNAWLIHANVDGLDPSEMSTGGNRFGAVEGAILPGVRSLGFSINAEF